MMLSDSMSYFRPFPNVSLFYFFARILRMLRYARSGL